MSDVRPSEAPRRRQLVDGELAVWSDEGAGPVIVMVHGLPGSGRHFRWLAPRLPGLRVIRVDLPGYGEAPIGRAPVGVTELGAYVAGVLRALEVPKAVVLGHSFGTSVALATALAAPEIVAGVALLAPVGLVPHRAFKRVPYPWVWSQAVHQPGVRRLMLPLSRALFKRSGFGVVSDQDVQRTFAIMGAFSFQTVGALAAAVEVPVFGAWAMDDALVQPELSEGVLDVLPKGPRLRFETGGHGLPKTQAAAIAEALQPWCLGLLND